MPASTAGDDIDDDDSFIVDIDGIQSHGVGAADITKLKSNGFYTIASVHAATRKTLLKIKGFSEVKVEKIKEAIQKCQPSASGFVTAMELGHQRRRVVRISTGSKQLDSILGGGFQSMSISEVYGEFSEYISYHMDGGAAVLTFTGCGKTQLSHTICLRCGFMLEAEKAFADGIRKWEEPQVKSLTSVRLITFLARSGLISNYHAVDTEGTFRPERIAQIAERFELDPEATQENILYARALNSEHQLELLNTLSRDFASNEFRLLIIDSIMNCFRVDFCGRGELADRQQKLNQFLSKLAHMAEGWSTLHPKPKCPAFAKTRSEFNVCVLMTNQVQSDPGANALFAGADGRKPVGGHILAHASTTRVLLRKGRGEERVAKIQDSPEIRIRLDVMLLGIKGTTEDAFG
ncbi:Meiotic recombination protein dmc1 [Acarospora aff. strigata]|nr:Meiotic recombination protein dmc1 [Acarospora aff. strigata]